MRNLRRARARPLHRRPPLQNPLVAGEAAQRNGQENAAPLGRKRRRLLSHFLAELSAESRQYSTPFHAEWCVDVSALQAALSEHAIAVGLADLLISAHRDGARPSARRQENVMNSRVFALFCPLHTCTPFACGRSIRTADGSGTKLAPQVLLRASGADLAALSCPFRARWSNTAENCVIELIYARISGSASIASSRRSAKVCVG